MPMDPEKPAAPSSQRARAEKAERTTIAALAAIDRERSLREGKTARLKALRLEQQRHESPAPNPPARKGRAPSRTSRRVQDAFGAK